MIKTKKLNEFKVSKIRLPQISQKKIKGGELIPLYSNTFIVAKKNSGKSTAIFNMLKKCADRDTILDLFVSTIEKDRSWIQIVKYFTDKGLTVNSHMSTVDDGENLIQDIIDQPVLLDDSDSSESEDDLRYISIDDPETEKKIKKRKPAKLAQKRIIVLDDIGSELKSPQINQLLKINRHLHSKVILSSQYLNDLSPQARRQIDIWMIFNGCKKEKLKTLMRDTDTHLDYDEFEQLYKYATGEKYNFLYVDTSNSTFRKNFNQQLLI